MLWDFYSVLGHRNLLQEAVEGSKLCTTSSWPLPILGLVLGPSSQPHTLSDEERLGHRHTPQTARPRYVFGDLPTRPQSSPGQALSELSLGPGTCRGGQQDRQVVCGFFSLRSLIPRSFLFHVLPLKN